jgi:hypothetical protein
MVPMLAADSAATSPKAKETLPPYISRASTSRPASSVRR